MTISRLLTFAILAFSASISPVLAQSSVAEKQDAQVIESLRKAGADLSKSHDIDFFLIFGRQADASKAATEMKELGYRVVAIEGSPDRSQWQVHAKRDMALALEAMNTVTRALESLAQANNGYYDGWGTIPVR